MSPAAADLLRRLVRADRAYWLARTKGEACSTDDRGVEVGAINGVSPRTAHLLETLGLCERVDRYVYLGSYNTTKTLKEDN